MQYCQAHYLQGARIKRVIPVAANHGLEREREGEGAEEKERESWGEGERSVAEFIASFLSVSFVGLDGLFIWVSNCRTGNPSRS